jgi:hypothetical protein
MATGWPCRHPERVAARGRPIVSRSRSATACGRGCERRQPIATATSPCCSSTAGGLLGGLCAIGVPRKHAFRIVEDIALDSTPPIRRKAFEMLTGTAVETRTIAAALRLPTTTARRALEDLCAQGLAVRTRGKNDEGEEKKGGADLWQIDPEWAGWRAKWAAGTAVPPEPPEYNLDV